MSKRQRPKNWKDSIVVTAEKLTTVELLREANEFTMMHRKKSKQSLKTAYFHRHSPIRTQMFIIRMYGIPSFVSVHFRTHAATGQQHYVGSNRYDLNEEGGDSRWSPTEHMMIVNAQHLEEMSWKRLCVKASLETRYVMAKIKAAVAEVDPDCADRMDPECIYLNSCHEPKPCPTL